MEIYVKLFTGQRQQFLLHLLHFNGMIIYRNNKRYDFYIPFTKIQILKWFKKYYTYSKTEKKIRWDKMNLSQLRAIYINCRIKREDKNEQAKKDKISETNKVESR